MLDIQGLDMGSDTVQQLLGMPVGHSGKLPAGDNLVEPDNQVVHKVLAVACIQVATVEAVVVGMVDFVPVALLEGVD